VTLSRDEIRRPAEVSFRDLLNKTKNSRWRATRQRGRYLRRDGAGENLQPFGLEEDDEDGDAEFLDELAELDSPSSE
jgi:hypothetical protein